MFFRPTTTTTTTTSIKRSSSSKLCRIVIWIMNFVMINISFNAMNAVMNIVLVLVLVVVVVEARPPMLLFNELLQRFHKKYPDFEPNAIIDIGANKGEWTKSAFQLFPKAKFLMIEASPMHNETLFKVTQTLQLKKQKEQTQQQTQDTQQQETSTTTIPKFIDYKIAVLSNHDDQVVSFFQGGDTGNSLFQEQTEYYQNQQPTIRIAQTLDTIIQNSFLKNERIDIIKADVQGAELIVFQGGMSRALQEATLVQFEGSTIQFNTGGSCTYTVDEWLRTQTNFYLYDIGGLVYNPQLFKTSGLGQYDVLYIRPDSKQLPIQLQPSNVEFCGYHEFQKQQSQLQLQTNGLHDNHNHNSGFWKGFIFGMITIEMILQGFKYQMVIKHRWNILVRWIMSSLHRAHHRGGGGGGGIGSIGGIGSVSVSSGLATSLKR